MIRRLESGEKAVHELVDLAEDVSCKAERFTPLVERELVPDVDGTLWRIRDGDADLERVIDRAGCARVGNRRRVPDEVGELLTSSNSPTRKASPRLRTSAVAGWSGAIRR